MCVGFDAYQQVMPKAVYAYLRKFLKVSVFSQSQDINGFPALIRYFAQDLPQIEPYTGIDVNVAFARWFVSKGPRLEVLPMDVKKRPR